MMFYNGFNLMIDILLGLSVWFFTRKSISEWYYSKGVVETLEGIDDESIHTYTDLDGDKVWCLPCDDGSIMEIVTGMDKRYNLTPAGLEALEASRREHDLNLRK